MSRSRRNFSAEFKTNLVPQLLKGEKELNVLAVENDIQPNLLRNWKKEFLANAEYYGAVTPQIRQAGNRLSGLPETNYCANLLA